MGKSSPLVGEGDTPPPPSGENQEDAPCSSHLPKNEPMTEPYPAYASVPKESHGQVALPKPSENAATVPKKLSVTTVSDLHWRNWLNVSSKKDTGDTIMTDEMMNRMLGNLATNDDAVRFENYLTAKGWELAENKAWRDGKEMTEHEWAEALADCFRTHRISLDNGMTFQSASEAMPEILERDLWEAIVLTMDEDARERVHMEFAPCTEQEFLTRYLEIAPFDLTIG